jgi:hypothetical protein
MLNLGMFNDIAEMSRSVVSGLAHLNTKERAG